MKITFLNTLMRLVFNIHKIILLIIIAAISSCKHDNNNPEPITVDRTILVYMVATNSLGSSGYDAADLKEMSTAVAKGCLNGGRLLVYYVSYNNTPTLLELIEKNGNVEQKTLKTYPNTTNSLTITVMSNVISDIKELATAKDYGLVLWSHATGWTYSGITPKSFGIDYTNEMDITQLALAIPDNTFSFIYSDACYMGGIEVAYQLRNKTNYYISSPAEVDLPGMPYDKNIPLMFESNIDYYSLGKSTYDYYMSRPEGSQNVTISVVDCSKLEEIANMCKSIISKSGEKIYNLDYRSYQKYSRSSSLPLFYDFSQVIKSLCNDNDLASWETLYNQLIIYKNASPYMYKQSSNPLEINPNTYSGLSTYIFNSGNSTQETYYKTLDWYIKVYNN